MSEVPGILATVDLNKEELDFYIKTHPTKVLEYLNMVLGEDALFEFLDVFSGQTIRVPSRDVSLRHASEVKIYIYLKNHNFSDSAKEHICSMYRIKPNKLVSIINKLSDPQPEITEEENEDNDE